MVSFCVVKVVGVRAYSSITSSDQIPIAATSSMPTVGSVDPFFGIVCGAAAGGAVLLIVIVILTGCLVVTVHRKRHMDIDQVSTTFYTFITFRQGMTRKCYHLRISSGCKSSKR